MEACSRIYSKKLEHLKVRVCSFQHLRAKIQALQLQIFFLIFRDSWNYSTRIFHGWNYSTRISQPKRS